MDERAEERGGIRRGMTWLGVGSIVGSLLSITVTVVLGWGRIYAEAGGWWAVAAVVSVLVLLHHVHWFGDRMPLLPGGPGPRPYRPWILAFFLVGAVVTGLSLPLGAAEALVPADGVLRPSPTAVLLWSATCASTLGCALLLLGARAPELRPARTSLPPLVVGALVVVLVEISAVPLLFPHERHVTWDDPTEPAPLPDRVERTGWTWEPPSGQGMRSVVPGPHGPVVLLVDGAVALDGATGEELWTFRRPYPGGGDEDLWDWNNSSDAWVDGGVLHVEYPDTDPARFGGDGRSTDPGTARVTVDLTTGEPVDGSFPSRERREEERDSRRTAWPRLVDPQGECDDYPPRHTNTRDVGFLLCDDTVVVVAVDHDGEELWRREWPHESDDVPAVWEGRRVADDPVLLVERGDAVPVGLDPETGEELLTFPDDLYPREYPRSDRRVLRADAGGSVVAARSGPDGLLLQSSDPEGNVLARVEVEGVSFDAVGHGAAVVLGATVLLPVVDGAGAWDRETGTPATVLEVPMTEGTVTPVPRGDFALVDLFGTPGGVVVAEGDEYGPETLRGLVP
ncbi:PQQ-binding-like beta-propeller repeat protein [Nocardiopsis sp. MG754419]|uniref:PQQ-binding-like beta-propeller repeat protein n=1 Tax=Nocardiopsis sp. MG754419 TaxID=2259865 RepID=UPI001BABFB5E|nr:PQQ-binding-like beta-propeller repeat protein [Nocardiopsis sp. MG754419]MBR8740139.1 hypothetical protein [Nocardiopsis sp. MG754419]